MHELSGQSARDAIVGPLASVGATIEAGLVDAIIDQTASGRVLLASPSPSPTGSAGDPEIRVQPAFLQLVMERLWAEARDSGSLALQREQLERLGGAARIVRMYVVAALEAFPISDVDVVAGLLGTS